MSRRLAIVVAVVFLSFTAGCPEDKPSSTPPATPVVTPADANVTADGLDSTLVNVTAGKAPITLTTSRGRFSTGTTTITLATVPGSATLTSCDARVTATCAGPTVITAIGSDGGYGQGTLTFVGFEDCDNLVDDNDDDLVDCADPQCPVNSPCSATGMVCLAGVCNKCTSTGTVEASAEQTCTDGYDNDCDGQVDCGDSDCAGDTCMRAAGALGVCDGSACVCEQTEAFEATCSDGRDNDCDGLADCADSDCVGKTCNAATGKQCTGLTPSTCAYCPTGQTVEAATQCGDGRDNDCDALIDCYDPDCQPTVVGGSDGEICNPFGGVCKTPSGVPSCGCSTGATTETSCLGGVDDDCDGLTDCADDDCQPAASGLSGPACDPLGRACTSTGTCTCPGGDVELCDNYDTGGAPVDDDCDGKANCLDFECRPATPGAAGEDCSATGEFGMACDATGTCGCTGNGGTAEAAELTCDDGFDNDCDFLLDCQDPDCNTRACGPGGAACSTAALSCSCPGGTLESSCTDGLDNNCNGKVDCEEPGCAALACSTTFTGYLCISSVCSDPSTQYGVKVTPARSRIPADGVATTSVEVELTYKGAPKGGVPVSFALSSPALGTLSATTVTTDSLGRGTVTFTSNGQVGVQTATATYTIAAGSMASGTATIGLPAIGEVRVLDPGGILYPVMGVMTSGYREQNPLVVEVLDASGLPYPDGLLVTFEHRPLGGSTLADPLPVPACSATPCVQSALRTDANGLARARLYSGTVAGVVRVSAATTAGGVTRRFELPGIAIVGAKPNAGHFSVICSPSNVPAYADTACHWSNVDAPITCVAFLKDRYNNVLGSPTTVSFMSEAGAVGPPAVTPEYDPTKTAESQVDLGTAIDFINTLGAKLPKDVTHAANEAFISSTADACGVSERNPRDGIVTVVAWTPGEEAFTDTNGNGQYNLGEPFVDLPEPFVDYDDDDVRDADEPFVDSDADGVWDAPNNVWDSSANIWTKNVVVYTGSPVSLTVAGMEYESRWMEEVDALAGTFPGPTPTARFDVRPAFDPEPFTDCNTNGRYDIAAEERYDDVIPVGGNGVYDLGEPFVDCNDNGVYDATPVPEAYSDENFDGVYNPFARPPTSEALLVTASDRNLNRLASAATYAVTKPDNTDFLISYNGEPQLPDGHGFWFGLRACNTAAIPTCALDCADVALADGRCTLESVIQDYSYGYVASVTLSGGPADSYDGATQAFWEVTLAPWKLDLSVSGTHQ